LCEAPEGPFRQKTPVPFSDPASASKGCIINRPAAKCNRPLGLGENGVRPHFRARLVTLAARSPMVFSRPRPDRFWHAR